VSGDPHPASALCCKSVAVLMCGEIPIKKGRSTASLLVELPGIEPATEITLSCRNVRIDDAKVRETTRNDLRIRESC
jgi:hypothetical protein